MKKLISNSRDSLHQILTDQRGMAFVTTVLLLLVLGLLVTISTQWSAMDIKKTANYTKTREAFFIADAGLQDAINEMNYDSDGNSPGAAGDNFSSALDSSTWPATFVSGVSFEGGNYTVNIKDNNDGDGDLTTDVDQTVIAEAEGMKNSRTSRIRAILHLPRSQVEAAVIAENMVHAAGTSSITGEAGSIHSNTEVKVDGATSVDLGATSAGPCTGVSPCYSGPQYERDIPKIFPRDFKDYADYVFYEESGTGRIKDQPNNVVYKKTGGTWKSTPGNNLPPIPGMFDVFTYNPGLNSWEQPIVNVIPGLNAPNNASIYFTESFNLAANAGTAANPWNVTVYAQGSINLGGIVYMNNCSTCGPDEAIQNLFLVAEEDVKISNLDTATVQGVIAALEQFQISGSAEIEGMIIGSDFEGNHEGPYDENATGPKYYDHDGSSVVTGDNLIGGSIHINYQGASMLPVTENKVRILSWKELRPNETF